jgi:hypothetical protein
MGTQMNLDQLNSFLRGEISAVETYRIALDRIDDKSPARPELERCMRSHQERVDILRSTIATAGGMPATGSGPWGVLVKAVEGGAAILGDKVAIAALEEGEDHGLDDYRDDMDGLDPKARELVASRILPLQEQTHRVMSKLKKSLA